MRPESLPLAAANRPLDPMFHLFRWPHSTPAFCALLWASFFGMALGNYVTNVAANAMGSTALQVGLALATPVGMMCDILLLHKGVTWLQVLGGVCVIAGVLVGTHGMEEKAAVREEEGGESSVVLVAGNQESAGEKREKMLGEENLKVEGGTKTPSADLVGRGSGGTDQEDGGRGPLMLTQENLSGVEGEGAVMRRNSSSAASTSAGGLLGSSSSATGSTGGLLGSSAATGSTDEEQGETSGLMGRRGAVEDHVASDTDFLRNEDQGEISEKMSVLVTGCFFVASLICFGFVFEQRTTEFGSELLQ